MADEPTDGHSETYRRIMERRRKQRGEAAPATGAAPVDAVEAPKPSVYDRLREGVSNAYSELTERTRTELPETDPLARAERKYIDAAMNRKVQAPGKSVFEARQEVGDALFETAQTRPGDRSLLQHGLDAFTPQTYREGERLRGTDAAKAMALQAPLHVAQTALAPLVTSPAGLAAKGATEKAIANVTGAAVDDAEGIAVEHPLVALLRVVGTATSAAGQEGASMVPASPLPLGNGRAIPRPTTPLDLWYGTASNVHEVLGGEEARGFREDYGGGLKGALHRVFEKVETGAGLDRDFSHLGYNLTEGAPEVLRFAAARQGFQYGLLADVLTNWEAAPVAAANKLRTMAKLGGALADGKVVGDSVAKLGGAKGKVAEALETARLAFSDELSEAEHMARRTYDQLVGGAGNLDDLPEPIKLRLAHAAETADVDLVESARAAGVEPGSFERIAEAPPPAPSPPPLPTRPGWMPSVAEARKSIPPFSPPHTGWKLLFPEGQPVRAGEWKPDAEVYRLIQADGGEVTGTLKEVTARMAARRTRGDAVVDAVQERPVARWGKVKRKTGAKRGPQEVVTSAIKADRQFSSPREAAWIGEQGVQVKPSTMRRAKRPSPAVEAVVDRSMGAMKGLLPPSRIAPDTDLYDLLDEAFRMTFRERIGSDRLVVLGNARVLPGEARRIRAGVSELFADAGVPLRSVGERLGIGARTVEFTAEEADGLRRLAARIGHELPQQGNSFSLKAWNDLQGAVMSKVGGLALRNRHLFRETPSFANALVAAVMRASGDIRPWKDAMGKDGIARPVSFVRRWAQSTLGVGGPASAIINPARVLPPESVRKAVRNLEAELENVNADIRTKLSDLAAKHTNRADLAAEVFAPVAARTPRPSMVAVADEIAAADPMSALDVESWLGRLRQVDPDRWAGVEFGETLQQQTKVFHDVVSWMQEQRGARDALVSEWAKAHIRQVDDTRWKLVSQRLSESAAERARIFNELVSGDLEGRTLRRLLVETIGLQQLHRPASAVVGLVVGMASKQRVEKAVSRLLNDGLAIPADSDRRVKTVMNLLDGARDLRNRTPSEIAEATATLNRWGLRPGDGAELDDWHDLKLPRYWIESLNRAADGGKYTSSRVFDSDLYNKATALYKEAVLQGLPPLVQNRYFLGQVVGAPTTLWMTRGAKATLDASDTFFANSRLVSNLVARGADTQTVRASALHVNDEVLATVDGRLYHLDQLEAMARRFGLYETAARFETSADVSRVLAQVDGSDAARAVAEAMPPRLRGIVDPVVLEQRWEGLRGWLRDAASVPDQMARLSTFANELRLGKAPEEAAAIAREALLDYGDLTAAERKVMRKAFMFYAFMRRNTEAFLTALVQHPERIIQQTRAFNRLWRPWALSEIQRISEDDSSASRMTLIQRAVEDDERFDSVAFQTTALGPAEGFMMLDSILDMLTLWTVDSATGGGLGGDNLLGSAHPIAQAAVVMGTGNTLDGYRVENFRSGEVPELLMNTPGVAPFMQWAFGVAPKLLDEDELDRIQPSASAAMGGRPAAWTVGAGTLDDASSVGASVQAAGQLRVWNAAYPNTIRPLVMRAEDYLRAFHVLEPREGLTWGDEIIGTATGQRPRPVASDRRAAREARAERAKTVRRDAALLEDLAGE